MYWPGMMSSWATPALGGVASGTVGSSDCSSAQLTNHAVATMSARGMRRCRRMSHSRQKGYRTVLPTMTAGESSGGEGCKKVTLSTANATIGTPCPEWIYGSKKGATLWAS